VVKDDTQIAAELRAQLASRIGPQRYELWFGSHTQFCVGDRAVRVLADSPFVRDWLRQHFAADVRASVEAAAGRELVVQFELGATQSHKAEPSRRCVDTKRAEAECRNAALVAATNGTPISDAVAPGNGSTARLARQRAEVGFDQFVVGNSNQYAYQSARLTSQGLQQASPVFFCGPTGVGKTHLLRAIHREYRRHHPRSRAVYLTAEQFTTCFVEALRGSGLPSFRQKCRGADLLVIDDLQFFVGKRVTLDELLHTADELLADGRQLVLAGDRGLVELRALGPELVSRLAGGLTCEIGPPEFATRLGIVDRLSRQMQLEIDCEVCTLVATQITSGVRELRGALYRLQATGLALRKPIDRQLAESALADLVRQSTRTVRLPDVQRAICDVFGVEPGELRSQRKGRSISAPRMLAMWLARKYTRAPWSEIGQFFGRRSHSTVISAHRRVELLIAEQAEIDVSDGRFQVEEAIRRLETALRTA
jgi:chromosomal replication initiator protein